QTLEEDSELVKALTGRGVNVRSARSLVAGMEEAKIREKIALFDWLSARKDPRVQKSPAGFLYRSITEDFSLPEDYRAAVLAPKPAARVQNRVPLQRQTPRSERSSKLDSERQAIDQFWNSLGAEEQGRIERE